MARGGSIALHDENGRQIERLTLEGTVRPLSVLDGRIVVVTETFDESDDPAALTPSVLSILDIAGAGLGRVFGKEFPAIEFFRLVGDVLVHQIEAGGTTSNVLDPVTGAVEATFPGDVLDAQRGRFLVARLGRGQDTLSEHDASGRGPGMGGSWSGPGLGSRIRRGEFLRHGGARDRVLEARKGAARSSRT